MEKEELIRVKSLKLFMRYGAKSVSMDNIASNLGMSKKTIYEHFKDKKELLTSCLRTFISEHKKICEHIKDKENNVIYRMVLLSKAGMEGLKTMNPSLLFDLQKYYRNSWQVFIEFRDGYLLDEITEEIEEGQKKGYFRKNIDFKTAAKLHSAQIEAVLNPDLFPPDEFDIHAVSQLTTEIFLRGICTAKGLKEFEKAIKNVQ